MRPQNSIALILMDLKVIPIWSHLVCYVHFVLLFIPCSILCIHVFISCRVTTSPALNLVEVRQLLQLDTVPCTLCADIMVLMLVDLNVTPILCPLMYFVLFVILFISCPIIYVHVFVLCQVTVSGALNQVEVLQLLQLDTVSCTYNAMTGQNGKLQRLQRQTAPMWHHPM